LGRGRKVEKGGRREREKGETARSERKEREIK